MSRQMSLLRALFLYFTLGVSVPQMAWSNEVDCSRHFSPSDLSKSWEAAQQSIREIRSQVYGQEDHIQAQIRSALSENFLFIFGPPGGAKTMTSRVIFEAMIKSIPEEEKKVFLIQFHKFISEKKITGYEKIDKFLEEGKFEINTESSLVGDKYLFLIADEVEKANPATLHALLSVLNERVAFHGSRVVKAFLSSGVFTSNKSIAEFLESFKEDRPAGEALIDRMGEKLYVLNQQLTDRELLGMQTLVEDYKTKKANGEVNEITPFPVFELQAILKEVRFSDAVLRDIEALARAVDSEITGLVNASRAEVHNRSNPRTTELFPSNQFSNRSVLRDLETLKASKVVEALWSGKSLKELDLKVTRKDLHLLANSFVTRGLGGLRPVSYDVSHFGDTLSTSKDGVPLSSTTNYGAGPVSGLIYFNARLHPYEDKLVFHTIKNDESMPVEAKIIRDDTGKIVDIESDFKDEAGVDEIDVSPAKYNVPPTVDIIDSDSKEVQEVIAVKEPFLAFLNEFESEEIVPGQGPRVNLNKPVYEVSDRLQRASNLPTLRKRQRQQIADIIREVNVFISNLELISGNEENEAAISYSTEEVPPGLRRSYRRGYRGVDLQKAYELGLSSFRSLNSRYLESSHAIKALFTGLLTDEHVYLFGPPGAAKTKLAREVLGAAIGSLRTDEASEILELVLKKLGEKPQANMTFIRETLNSIREEDAQAYDVFILQFHKFLPEGVLVGSPKLNKMMSEGVEEIEVATSLAARKFVYALLDETDKGNPQTFAALLSILNERQIFHGQQQFDISLKMAVLTSNKMIGELLDSFGDDDRPSAEALLDRIVFKVFMLNKMADSNNLLELMKRFLSFDLREDTNLLIPVGDLKKLAAQVEVDPTLDTMVAEIRRKFLGDRIPEAEKTYEEYLENFLNNPDYHVPAQAEASDRTYLKTKDILKAIFIVEQMSQGVPFSELRMEMTAEDLYLLYGALGYWVPVEFSVEASEANTTYSYSANVGTIQGMLESGRLLRRSEYFLTRAKEDVEQFTQRLGEVVNGFLKSHQDFIGDYKSLFPNLVLPEKNAEKGDDGN